MSPTIDEKYQIVSEVGRGGMGVVYEAIHLGLGHRVAIKFLAADELQNEAVLARFAREARAGANIASEHVARVFDIGITKDNVPYLVMELLEGDDLATVLQEHAAPLLVEDAVRFVLQALSAIAEAHALGIIHRDLKPDNLFLHAPRGGTPTVKVLDFGLAKICSQVDAAQTELEVVFGTPKYMAPEQLKSTAKAGAEADIWALGAILYQLLTGYRPFEGNVLSVVVSDILTKDPAPMTELRPDLPRGLEEIVRACLDRDPRQRPTARELESMLAPFVAESARRPGEPVIARSMLAVRLRRTERIAIALGLLALFFAGVTTSLVSTRGDGRRVESSVADQAPNAANGKR